MNAAKKLWQRYGIYITNILIALLTGTLASLFTSSGMDSYAALNKPPLSPPAAVFPIAWTILYVLMGISAGIIQSSAASDSGKAMNLYYAQLAANFLWPIIFFGLQARGAAFIWILVLIALVFLTFRAFRKISPKAAALFIPYLLWLAFAAYLNFGAYILNR